MMTGVSKDWESEVKVNSLPVLRALTPPHVPETLKRLMSMQLRRDQKRHAQEYDSPWM